MIQAGFIFFGDKLLSEAMLDMPLESRGGIPNWPNMVRGVMCMASRCVSTNPSITFAHCLTYMLQNYVHAKYVGEPIPEHRIEALGKMVEDVTRFVNSDGLIESPPSSTNWCDWSRVTFGPSGGDQLGVSIASNAIFFKVLDTLGQVAGLEKLQPIAERLRSGLRKLANPYIDRTGPRAERCVPDLFIRQDDELQPHGSPYAWNFADTIPNRSETTNYWLLWSGALDAEHAGRLWEVLRDWRVNEIQRRDNTRLYGIARCDMYGLWPRLSFARERKDAKLLYRDLREALGDMVTDGNTFWEVMSEDSRSNAHGYTAYAGTLLFEGLTGIQPADGHGYDRPVIAPLIDDTVDWARGHLETQHGTIGVSWQRSCDSFKMTVGLPECVQAEVHLPPVVLDILLRGQHPLAGSGKYLINSTTTFEATYDDGLLIDASGQCESLDR